MQRLYGRCPSQSMNGATRWVIPIDWDFTCILCHAVKGGRNLETISWCTRERGARESCVTETLYGLCVSAASLGCSGARSTNIASISAVCGTVTFPWGEPPRLEYYCGRDLAKADVS